MILLPKGYHPDFVYPDRKPLGPVEIDFTENLAQGLWGVWLLNEAKVFNLTNGNIATINGATQSITDEGEVYSFDGAQDNIILNNGSTGTKNITVIGRCRYNSGANDHCLIDFNNQQFILWADTSGGNIRTGAYAGGTPLYGPSAGLPVGEWVTWGAQVRENGSNAECQIWVENQIDAAWSNIGTLGFDNETNIRIGENAPGNKDMDGDYSYLYVWDRTLSDAEFIEAVLSIYLRTLKPLDFMPLFQGAGVAPSFNPYWANNATIVQSMQGMS